MSHSDILLSICVPTFNRRFLLERNVTFHLEQFRRLSIPFELVVVDDCSTDDTADYLALIANEPEVRVFRRTINSGFVSNYAFAMRRARGRYALFLGDDDLLIPEKVADYLALLESDPAIGMIQAPWMLVDVRDGGGDCGTFYQIPQPVRNMCGDFRALLDFVFDHHVFPEFMIVRRDVLAKTVSGATPFIFWAYLFTARALEVADVLFAPEPFARVTVASDDPRLQQGNRECMFEWDRYRGGLEYLAARMWRGDAPDEAQRRHVSDRISDFMLIRQSVALDLHLEAGNWAEAYILYHRMAACRPVRFPEDMLRTVGKMAGIVTAASEAAAFSALPAVVDPRVTDALIARLAAPVRARLTRELPAPGDAQARAWLRMSPGFGEPLRESDAAFDIPDYIAQFG